VGKVAGMEAVQSSRWTHHALLAWLLLLAAFALAYRLAPANDFHFDDRDSITERASVRIDQLNLDSVLHAGRDAFLPRRPLPSMTFAVDWWRGGGDPAPFIWTNLMLHAASVTVVFAMLIALLAGGGPPRPAMVWAAAAGAGVWLLHPIQLQSVTYIVQRMAEMAALFSLLSVFAYVHARTRSRHSWAWFLVAATSFIFAALCKENAWLTPLLWLLAEFGMCRTDGPLVRYPADRLLLLLPLIGALWLLCDVLLGGPVSGYFRPGFSSRDFTLEERLLTQPRVILFHFSQILWPLPSRFSLEHDFTLSSGFLDPPATLAAWLLVAGWLIVGVRLLFAPATRTAGFCMLWLPATLVVESSIVPLEILFEHRMYLPSFGLAGLLAIGCHTVWRKRSRFRLLVVLLVLSYLALIGWATQARVPDWRSTVVLYETALEHAPTSHRLWGNLSSFYAEQGDWAAAERAARRALEMRPDFHVARETLAVLALEQGDAITAEMVLRELVSSGKVRHPSYNHLGEALFAQERMDEAVLMFFRAIEMAPWVPPYYWNLALASEHLRSCRRAFTAWRRYLELAMDSIEKDRVEAHLNEIYRAADGACSRPGGWPAS